MQQDNLLVVTTSCPDITSAKTLANLLVSEKWVACAQITPITSLYRWQDELCEEQEFKLELKCIRANYKTIEQKINQHHPYEVAEIIASPITQASPAYVDWIKTNSNENSPCS